MLPIAERELRVAARKNNTFWTRVAAALVALVIGIGFFIIAEKGGLGMAANTMGKGLFMAMTWLTLAVALSAGLFFTADCLSEEKRDGTLGLLFLTDLRGYDVVIGKLLATSLRSVFAMIALLPMFALTLLMGGVTGKLFWQSAVALLNALFISLAAGLLISTISRDPQKAMGGTLLLLAGIAGGGPGIDALVAGDNPFQAVFSFMSPVYLLWRADAWKPWMFWDVFIVNQLIAWLMLFASCVLLPRRWQTRAAPTSATESDTAMRPTTRARKSSRRWKLLELNPITWLGSNQRWQAVAVWGVTVVFGLLIIGLLDVDNIGVGFIWSWAGGALTLVLYLAVASQSSRFFVDAQRSGLTELLLATPLTVREIVSGHWRALGRSFGFAVLLWLSLHLVGSAWSQYTLFKQMAGIRAQAPAPKPPNRANTNSNTTIMTNSGKAVTTTVVLSPAIPQMQADAKVMAQVTAALSSLASALTLLANLIALAWFGMFMGLTSKTSGAAALKTLLFVQVIPWFVFTFATTLFSVLGMMAFATSAGGSFIQWYAIVTVGLNCALALTKDAFFIYWSRKKLYGEFRDRAAGTYISPRQLALVASPPPLPGAIGA